MTGGSRLRVLLAVLIAAVAVAGVVVATRAPIATGPEPYRGPTRDLRALPFAWDSIWNLPLAGSAEYSPFNTRAQDVYLDIENITVDPATPVRDLESDNGTRRVHVDPRLSADGSYNNCSTFLAETPDDETVLAGQPLKLDPGGTPRWNYTYPSVSLRGDGRLGCHGGSNLSGIGGTIRVGEMTGPEPLRHALKINLNCQQSCSTARDGFRWPAFKADAAWRDQYRGSDPNVNMGTLLAIAPDTDLSWITEKDTRKIAEALRDYGAYVVDETGGEGTNAINAQAGAEAELPNIDSPQMLRLVTSLAVVTNNGPDTPGGGPLGSPRRVACALPFADGTGGAPEGC
ncbi:hypothetical protein EV188_10892 [Actinomycetospora succinea]|uniref:Uncharacterized protein n=1 Tax=Actinomycetospora succinea TaxID=663603 RepID=A0A4R6UWN4_9PSEU|nr:hypothetical protein [Actinomycetospora succinea]TDQ51732.1 hypothetical protein EV188_10892 [Actinomycetospora succinea]